ncbi:MAG: tetratricopeptide repeat protein [Acidobacteriota bacterium]|nr:tetratricopeptide repeat protein [Acidobacteriota bacterium]
MKLRFAEFTLDGSQRQLFKGVEAVRVSPKAFHLLTLLVQERPRALSKADLQQTLWSNTFVSDGSLATLVGELRSALGDDRRQSRFIRTLHGFGYSFTGEVSEEAPATGRRVTPSKFAALACALAVALVSARSVPSGRSVVDDEARRAYAEGKQLIDYAPDDAETLSRALVAFKRAATRAPDYADAWAGIAHCYAEMGFASILLPAEAFPSSRDAAVTALRLNSNLGDAYVSIADVESEYEWNREKAEEHYLRALSLSPGDSRAHMRYAFFLAVNRRFDEAVPHANRAVELNPSGHAGKNLAAWISYLARRYDTAIRDFRSALESDPDNAVLRENLADAYLAAGRAGEAFAVYQQWARLAGYAPEQIEALDRAWRTDGMTGYWRQRIAMEREEQLASGDVFSYRMALLYARAGDSDNAFEWLERAYEQRSNHLLRLAAEPAFDKLRGDVRFHRLMQRVEAK